MKIKNMWVEWVGSDEQWDGELLAQSDYCIFQSSLWALHRRDFGWNVIRLVELTSNCHLQVLTKNLHGVTIAWTPGGPLDSFDRLDKTLIKLILRITSNRHLYFRIGSFQKTSTESVEQLQELGWRIPSHKFSSGLSLTYSLKVTEEDRRELLSPNWSRNLRRGESRNTAPYLWTTFTTNEIDEVYKRLSDYKNLKPGADVPTPAAVASIVKQCGKNLRIFRCDDQSGNPLALRGALIFGSKAWDIFAAATPAGRKLYSSHVTTWALLNWCGNKGIDVYDLSGVDPVNNKGVSDFKKGTGANDIEYLGEWDIGTPQYVRPVVGRLIGYRSNV